MKDVEFVAIGRAHDRGYQRYLEQRYSGLPNLRATGFVDPFSSDAIHHTLSRAWVLIHPAAREGLPTAFQEASAHEVAILAHVDPGGYVSQFGQVVPNDGRIDTLEGQLRGLLESGAWLEKGKAGRAWNAQNHALPVSLAAHLAVYRQKLEEKQPARARSA
jgi:hypothetical protein